jgi:serine/threonine protein kinase/tetratricopeptide (TPR) repeat protein
MGLASGTLLGPYEILGPLGAGGMGEVYRARDTRLERTVAVKVLPTKLAGDRERRERLEREARAVAALSHAHICALFDIGDHEGSPYLVMEYLEGDSLAERISRGPLPVGDATRLAGQIAEALAAAHAQGVVHRDLKPANVKITSDGRAKVLDFGLAKRTEAESAVGDSADLPTASVHMTAANVVMGTAGYMSPEQARGQTVDQRTDIWSLGVLTFEMLTGRRLFAGDTMADLLVAVLQQGIRFDELPDGTPREVREILVRCLERDANRRASDMNELVRTFQDARADDRPSVTAAPAAPAENRDRSIAVLPFANLSPDPDNEYFSDGLTEEVIADLSKVDALRVISRSTAMRFKGGDRDLQAIATRLAVRYVLEGSVRKAGNNVRITAQLVDVDTDAPVWSDKFTGTLDDVFEIQEQVSRSIVEALRVKLTDSESRALRERPAAEGYVYDVYLRTRRDVWSFTSEGLDRAVAELEQALETAGDNPLLYSRLGTAAWQYHNAGLDTDPARLTRAQECAEKLRELDPQGPYADVLLALISASRGEIVPWVRYGKRAEAIAPKVPEVVLWLGIGWTIAGYPHHAKPILERIRSIDPLYDFLYAGLGFYEYFEGRFEDAIAEFEKARALTPENPAWFLNMSQAASCTGDVERVEEIMRKWGVPPEAHPLAPLAHMTIEAMRGKRDLLDRVVDDAYRAKVWPDLQYANIMGRIYALAGDLDESLRWLEQSVNRGWINYPFWAERDRAIDNVRSDPRFDALLESVREQWEGFEARVG